MADFFGCCVYIFDRDGNCLRKFGSKKILDNLTTTGVSYVNDNEILIVYQGNLRIRQQELL